MFSALLLLLAAGPGRPLYYWGALPPLIVTGADPGLGWEAQIEEVHAVMVEGDLLLRLTFDRPVHDALYLPGGEPVSGRLRAALYLDVDGDRASGLDEGPRDLRTGADLRIDVGVVALAEDKEEKLPATALVTASLAALSPEGRRRSLWRADDSARPHDVSGHGDWVEVRVPGALAPVRPGARLILVVGERSWDARLAP